MGLTDNNLVWQARLDTTKLRADTTKLQGKLKGLSGKFGGLSGKLGGLTKGFTRMTGAIGIAITVGTAMVKTIENGSKIDIV